MTIENLGSNYSNSPAVDNKSAGKPIAITSTHDVEGEGEGFRVSAGKNVTYLMMPKRFTPGEIERFQHLIQPIKESSGHAGLTDIEEYKDQMEGMANARDYKAIVRVNGKIVAMYQQEGGVTSTNTVGNIVRSIGANVDALVEQLRKKYGSSVSVENYSLNQGPTRAEAFVMFNGRSFANFVDSEVHSRQQDLAEHQRLIAKSQLKRNQFNQVAQSAVFRVNGNAVGSISDKGYVTINAPNLIQETDSSGLERESIKGFFHWGSMNNTDSLTVESMLRKVFGDAVDVESFAEGSMPTRGEVGEQSRRQFMNRYVEIEGRHSISRA